jgi:hypothetical protein
MMKYTVRYNGVPVKEFIVKADAQKYMVYLTQWQATQSMVQDLVEAAVTASDMSEAKEVLSYIMEKK